MNGGSMDTAPTASGEAKEKAGHRTRSASRLSLVNGGGTDTAPTASGEAKEKAGHRTRNAVRLPSGERISTDRGGSGDPGSAW